MGQKREDFTDSKLFDRARGFMWYVKPTSKCRSSTFRWVHDLLCYFYTPFSLSSALAFRYGIEFGHEVRSIRCSLGFIHANVQPVMEKIWTVYVPQNTTLMIAFLPCLLVWNINNTCDNNCENCGKQQTGIYPIWELRLGREGVLSNLVDNED